MGITCKPIGEFRSMMTKLDNQLKNEQVSLKKSAVPKKPSRNSKED